MVHYETLSTLNTPRMHSALRCYSLLQRNASTCGSFLLDKKKGANSAAP